MNWTVVEYILRGIHSYLYLITIHFPVEYDLIFISSILVIVFIHHSTYAMNNIQRSLWLFMFVIDKISRYMFILSTAVTENLICKISGQSSCSKPTIL